MISRVGQEKKEGYSLRSSSKAIPLTHLCFDAEQPMADSEKGTADAEPPKAETPSEDASKPEAVPDDKDVADAISAMEPAKLEVEERAQLAQDCFEGSGNGREKATY